MGFRFSGVVKNLIEWMCNMTKLTTEDYNLSAVEDAAFKIEDDSYYNLFDGGYIDPEDILKDSAKAELIRNAINVIKNYIDVAQDLVANLEESEDE